MTNGSLFLHQRSIFSRSVVIPTIDFSESTKAVFSPSADSHFEASSKSSIEALHKILKRLAGIELPGKEHVEAYLRYLCRRNRRPRTLASMYTNVVLFLGMIKANGKTCIEEITKEDMGAFIEHEQDRGIMITTIQTKLVCVRAFLPYLVDEEIILPNVLSRRIRLQLPDQLPRAMDPDDLQRLLSVIDHTQDRAMILVLLRTGMRIGELLDTKVIDVHFKERRIEIYEAQKNRVGRVVYLSADAADALRGWFKIRDEQNEFLFYCRGKSGRMCYSSARKKIVGYFVKAGLAHKGYTVHTLRHTFATELLNAGMRLECLQVLLGHRCIEETRDDMPDSLIKPARESILKPCPGLKGGRAMSITNAIINWRRFLKRRNCSPNTIKNYLNAMKSFVVWLTVTLENVTHATVSDYIDYLMRKRLEPKTINCHLNSISQFYHYLCEEEHWGIINPIRKNHRQRMGRPLPRHLKDDQVETFFKVVKGHRDRAVFMLMIRCGLRVKEVANISLEVLDFKHRKILIEDGKGSKDRIVYMSNDVIHALAVYLKARTAVRTRKVFLVEKGPSKGQPISIRGIQKRMEYYSRKAELHISCHQLRHTMATQLLNADADLCTIQDLLGHSNVKTTQRYCRVSNLKMQRDYFNAMEVIAQQTACGPKS